jgi:hypothetical protein
LPATSVHEIRVVQYGGAPALTEDFDVESLRDAVAKRRIHWNLHALERMLEREISRAEVIEAMTEGEIIEVYAADRPYPSCLILRLGTQPLHVVAAVEPGAHICHVITAYRPGLDRFEPGFRQRRKR